MSEPPQLKCSIITITDYEKEAEITDPQTQEEVETSSGISESGKSSSTADCINIIL